MTLTLFFLRDFAVCREAGDFARALEIISSDQHTRLSARLAAEGNYRGLACGKANLMIVSKRFQLAANIPENEMIVLTLTGWTASPSVAITVSP